MRRLFTVFMILGIPICAAGFWFWLGEHTQNMEPAARLGATLFVIGLLGNYFTRKGN